METLEVQKGLPASLEVTLRDAAGAPLVFAGTESIRCKVWPGDDEAEVIAPAVAWLSAGDGTATISPTATNTNTLAAGLTYVLAVDVQSGSDWYERYRAFLKVGYRPGSGTAGTTYCTYTQSNATFQRNGSQKRRNQNGKRH